jgi:hypothetical protein
MKNSLFKGLLISLTFLILLNVCCGSFFLDYESLFNAGVTHEFSTQVNFDLAINTYVFLINLVSFINIKLATFNTFSFLLVFLNLSILSTLIGNLLFHLDKAKVSRTSQGLTVIIALLLIFPSQLQIHNHYISFLMSFSAGLSLYTIQKYKLHKSYKLLVVGLILGSLLVRLEVASIFYLLFLSYAILYNKKLRKPALIIFAICLILQAGYHMIINKNEVNRAVFSFEHEIQDRQSVDFQSMSTQDWYTYRAMGKFIVDNPNFTIKTYSEYLDQQDRMEYLFSKNRFFNSYLEKLSSLSSEMSRFTGHLILLFVLMGFVFYEQVKNSPHKRKTSLKLLGFYLINLGVPLGLSSFLTCTPQIVFSISFSLGFVCLIYLSLKGTLQNTHLLLFIVPLAISVVVLIQRVLSNQNAEEINAESLRTEMLSSFNKNETIVFTYLPSFTYYPAKLFRTSLNKEIPHYYLDIGILNHVKPFKDHNQAFFGLAYFSLKDRMLKCANNEKIVLISTEEYNAFLTDYIRVKYQDTFRFEEVPNTSIEGELNKYYLFY